MAEGRRVNAVARTVLMAAAAVALAAARPAPGAAPPAPTPDVVSVTILGIHATTQPQPHISPALRPIADELRRSKYNSFDLVASDVRTLAVGGSMETALLEGYSLRVVVEKVTGDTVQLVLSWSRQGQVRQQVRMALRKGKYFLTGGWELQENGALLAAIAAR
jgi:hypothetical protein